MKVILHPNRAWREIYMSYQMVSWRMFHPIVYDVLIARDWLQHGTNVLRQRGF